MTLQIRPSQGQARAQLPSQPLEDAGATIRAERRRLRMTWKRALLAFTLLVIGAIAALSAYSYRPDLSAGEVEQRYATVDSRFVRVDGVRVHYIDVGTGKPIVLIHGSNSSLFDWQGWTTELRRDFRVIALDLPGHGLTGPDPAKRYTYIDQARFVDDFTRSIRLPSYSVAGNSMGGSVAWHLALMEPTRVEKLILVDSVGLPREEPRPLMFRMYEWPVVDRLLTVFTPRESVAMALHDAFGDPDRVTDEEIDRTWTLLRREGNREATRLRLQQQSDSDGWESRLPSLNMPTLILWGANDDWVLPKYGHRFQALIPNAQLITYPGLGHLPMLESPEATSRDARTFLLAGRG